MDAETIVAIVAAGFAAIGALIAIRQANSASKQAMHAEEQADAALIQAAEAERSANAAEAQVSVARDQLRQAQSDALSRRLDDIRLGLVQFNDDIRSFADIHWEIITYLYGTPNPSFDFFVDTTKRFTAADPRSRPSLALLERRIAKDSPLWSALVAVCSGVVRPIQIYGTIFSRLDQDLFAHAMNASQVIEIGPEVQALYSDFSRSALDLIPLLHALNTEAQRYINEAA